MFCSCCIPILALFLLFSEILTGKDVRNLPRRPPDKNERTVITFGDRVTGQTGKDRSLRISAVCADLVKSQSPIYV